MATDLTAYCARAYGEVNGDRNAAATLLASWARENPELDDAILGNLRVQRCWELMRTYESHRKRTTVEAQQRSDAREWQPTPPVPGPVSESLAAARAPETHAEFRLRAGGKSAAGVMAMGVVTLLYRPLPNGRRMTEATGDDLAEAIQHHRAVETENARNVRYYTAVWTQVGADKRVGDVMTEDALRELWQAAEER
jgi:hypothetical protein